MKNLACLVLLVGCTDTKDVGFSGAQSLAMRFDNETLLIQHTQEKQLWGWGSFGRNRKYDPDSGRDITVTDGEWGIHYSVRGGIGVVSWFWMMALPVFWAANIPSFSDVTSWATRPGGLANCSSTLSSSAI